MEHRILPRSPVVVRTTGHVYFPVSFIRKFDLTSHEYEWAEDSINHTLALVPVKNGRKLQKNGAILLPIRITERYVGTYDLEKQGDIYILIPIK